MKEVKVVWHDAMAIAEWTKFRTPLQPQKCEAKGYLAEDEIGYIVVAATISGDEYNAGIMILRSMIESIEEIP